MAAEDFSIDVSFTSVPQRPSGESLVGEVLGGFRLVRLLGTGGMGSVYQGEHTLIGSKVAVKVLHPELSANKVQVERFHAEAKAVNLIDHENIVRIFDLAQDKDRHYFVMEYLEGKPLTSWCGQPVPAEVAVPLLAQTLSALSAAHARGVVHRDLKPDNLFVIGRRGEPAVSLATATVKVLDFGVAKLFSDPSAPSHTLAGMAIGTPAYMSPEQWMAHPVDGRSDLYSLGVLAYLLATGRMPFPKGSLLEQLAFHRERTPEAPHDVCPSVPRALSLAILRALEKRPENRFQTADEMSSAVRAVLVDRDRTREAYALPTPPPIAPVRPEEVTRVTPPPRAHQTPVPSPAKATPVPASAPGTAEHLATRYSVRVPARVSTPAGKELFAATCTQLSRGGLFVNAPGIPPPIFARVDVVLALREPLVCRSEVVRHVNAEDAARWNMEPGFAVQFVEPTAELKQAITALLKQAAPVAPGLQVASRLARISAADFYAVLDVSPAAAMVEIDDKADQLERELFTAEPSATGDDKKHLREARQKVGVARSMLLDPRSRAEHDVQKRNPLGIARCIDAGVDEAWLERLHAEFAARFPYEANAATLRFISGSVWEKRGDLEQARSQYEAALKLDPANVRMHQALRALGPDEVRKSA